MKRFNDFSKTGKKKIPIIFIVISRHEFRYKDFQPDSDTKNLISIKIKM